MRVNDVEIRQQGEFVRAVQSCKNILSVNGKVNNFHAFREELFQLAAVCGESNGVIVIYLFVAELQYIAFYSAFFKLWNYVKNVHQHTSDNFCEIIANVIICEIHERYTHHDCR